MKTYSRDFFIKAGRKGGKKTFEKHGKKHFQKIQKQSVLKSRANKDIDIAVK